MKFAIVLAIASLSLAAPQAWAHHQDGDPDLAQSITNVHESHFPHSAGDNHEPERGGGDTYGALLLDIQAGESHVPHRSGDSHAPEKGSGDTYGSALRN